jgi:hypothetical protein
MRSIPSKLGPGAAREFYGAARREGHIERERVAEESDMPPPPAGVQTRPRVAPFHDRRRVERDAQAPFQPLLARDELHVVRPASRAAWGILAGRVTLSRSLSRSSDDAQPRYTLTASRSVDARRLRRPSRLSFALLIGLRDSRAGRCSSLGPRRSFSRPSRRLSIPLDARFGDGQPRTGWAVA